MIIDLCNLILVGVLEITDIIVDDYRFV